MTHRSPEMEGLTVPQRSKPPTPMTLGVFAKLYGFNRFTTYRTCRDEPGLAELVAHPSAPGGRRFEVTDPERLAAVIRARLERHILRFSILAGRPPPATPPGQLPVGEACDGDD